LGDAVQEVMARDRRVAFPSLLTDDEQQISHGLIYNQNGSGALAIQQQDRNHNLWIPGADFEC